MFKSYNPYKLEDKMKSLHHFFSENMESFLGYPCNGKFDYRSLYPFLDYPLNNVGDPFVSSNFALNTHNIEREVIEIFQDLTKADKSETWGYCTNGGTEGNMYGLFLAREIHPNAIVYYSDETHYSVNKIIKCLNIKSTRVKALPKGEMDLNHLNQLLYDNQNKPAIIVCNVGTTMKGAIDDLKGIRNALKKNNIKRSYIHADAALSGMILPFVKDPQSWSFADGIDSISISGHKMIGSPIPCGIVLAKSENIDHISQEVEYVGSKDTTIPGSRNAISPVFLWYQLKKLGFIGFQRMIKKCFDVADFSIKMFKAYGIEAWRHNNSVTVVFKRPSDYLIKKWQLAVNGETAHIITMPHVTKRKIVSFVKEIAEDKKRALKQVSSL
ncbi:histidine decarboxylase [Bacteriovoracales bacterium]|nr:histidine decarboxylase [Bacteriovoracales bacterium]